MAYHIKEIFYSVQGEGAQSGRPAIFCRFSGCNLWSGLEKDRASAKCHFCDTDFVGTDGKGGGNFKDSQELVDAISSYWPKGHSESPYVLLVGGEPSLQINQEFIDLLHHKGAIIGIETNGTRPLPNGIDWICVSPKAGTKQVVKSGDEIKLVFPQKGQDPSDFMEQDFERFYLQPMYGPDLQHNMKKALLYCLENPKWRLSLQIQKVLHVR